MTAVAERIFNEAQALDEEERIALAERLMGSVHLEAAIFAERLEISRQRATEIESGLVEAVPGEEAFRKVREALAENRLSA